MDCDGLNHNQIEIMEDSHNFLWIVTRPVTVPFFILPRGGHSKEALHLFSIARVTQKGVNLARSRACGLTTNINPNFATNFNWAFTSEC